MRFLPRSAAALAVAALFPMMAAAQQPAQEQVPQGPQRRVVQQRPQQRAQLTEQQREQLRTFDEQQRQSLETTRRELGDLHRQLDEALTAAQLDQSKINSLRSSIVQKETALAQARVDRLARVLSVLTAEQRQAFRGRGLGQVFGPGGPRGGVMAGPGGRGGQRGLVLARPGDHGRAGQGRGGVVMQRRQGEMRELRMRRAPRNDMAGGGRGGMLRQRVETGRGGGNDVNQLRAEIRRLEAQLDALRRRIR